MVNRKHFDLDAYLDEIQTRPCFICEMIAGRLQGNHVIHQDKLAITFLNKYPTLYGYALVAPIAHKEQVTADFTPAEYLALQQRVYQVAEAVRLSVSTERVYILSLGSQQGNTHVHWHIAPLPPGVPFEEQQLAALSVKTGILNILDDEMAELANRFRQNLDASIRSDVPRESA
jgi:diadenosine tetraphosphate (Ap4A) HIT family hydrolase